MNPLEGKTKEEIEQLLRDYIATVNNPEYKGDKDIINAKFPEFQGIDAEVLEEYIATYDNPDYSGNYAVINAKFPEFFEGAGVKKKTHNKDIWHLLWKMVLRICQTFLKLTPTHLPTT